MNKLIKRLTKYLIQIVNDEEIDISRKVNIEKHIQEAISHLDYANRIAKENNIKLGD